MCVMCLCVAKGVPFKSQQLVTMARVSRATAASNRRQSIASKQASELYPSINTLKSELEADDSDHVTCGQWLKTCKLSGMTNYFL